MSLLEKLQELEGLRVCDEETVEALKNGKDFISYVVEKGLKDYKEKKEKFGYYNNRRMILGSRLLFLEKLVQEPLETREAVIDQLSEEKLKFLFTISDYGHDYGELLLAKQENKLDEYRQQFNPNSTQQPEFEYSDCLETSYNLDVKSIEKGKELIERKLEKVLKKTATYIESGINYYTDFYLKVEDDEEEDQNRDENLDGLDIETQFDMLDDRRHIFYELTDDNIFNEDRIRKEILNAEDKFYDESHVRYALPQSLVPYLERLRVLKIINEEELRDFLYWTFNSKINDEEDFNKKLNPLIERFNEVKKRIPNGRGRDHQVVISLKNKLMDDSTDYDEFENSDEYYMFKEILGERITFQGDIMSEFDSLRRENILLNEKINEAKKISSKYKNPKPLKYTIELSNKDPLDITFGNDSGCCVGLYVNERGDIGNAECIPYYIADNATYIFNINQQKGEGKKRRTGIVLAFESKDDLGNRVLACNSIEISPVTNPHSCIPDIVNFTEKALRDFAKDNDFESVLMSTHDYNTSYNYSKIKGRKPKREEILMKVNPNTNRDFYSEIVNIFGKIEVNNNDFYLIHDRRKLPATP